MKHTTLPAKPVGWTRRMVMHMNFGRDGGAATYAVFDPDGNEADFAYQYDTRLGGRNGFTLAGVDGVLTWAQLVQEYPAYVARRDKQATGATA